MSSCKTSEERWFISSSLTDFYAHVWWKVWCGVVLPRNEVGGQITVCYYFNKFCLYIKTVKFRSKFGFSHKYLFSIAYIDFAESEEIEDDVLEIVRGNVTNLIDDFERHLSNARVGERLREGVHLAIVGEPNVGKSSLLNFLVQRPAAIVSATAGTTR